jgi:site-specific DNA-methyltransferase (adenine-specific)
MIEKNKIYNEDCLIGMQSIDDDSIDCILTDPPYLYLKNQKLDRPFDEQLFFNEAKRVLKQDGFIVMFGRGTSFYRWNCILADLGFTFKEEIVWNKRIITSPVIALGRIHETVSIHALGGGKINSVKVEFFEKYRYEPQKILRTIDRIASTFGNRKTFALLKEYYESGHKVFYQSKDKFNVTRGGGSGINQNRTIVFAEGLEEGIKEQSIISMPGDHYSSIHPTQKPVRLLERLLALVTKSGDLILDPFSGSGSTAIAAFNTGRDFVGFEIDKEYYDLSIKRLDSVVGAGRQIELFNGDGDSQSLFHGAGAPCSQN